MLFIKKKSYLAKIETNQSKNLWFQAAQVGSLFNQSEICQNQRYTLRPKVSNPSGGVVSTMFCLAKSAKNKLFLCGDFRPLPNKNVQFWDHFFPALFPRNSESLKIFRHPTLGSGGKIGLKIQYMKRGQTNKEQHTDIATTRLNRPSGPI